MGSGDRLVGCWACWDFFFAAKWGGKAGRYASSLDSCAWLFARRWGSCGPYEDDMDGQKVRAFQPRKRADLGPR